MTIMCPRINFRNKNLGKYFLIIICILMVIFAHMYTSEDEIYYPGVVLSKSEYDTVDKYSEHKYVISFKYDKSEYGTTDIPVTFSTYTRLQPGSRASFQHKSEINFLMGICMVICVASWIIGVIIGLVLFSYIISYIWNF